MKQPPKTLLLWVVVLVAFLSIWHFLSMDNPQPSGKSYSEFIALTKAPADQPHVREVDIKDRDYTFTVKGPKGESKHRTVGPARAEIARVSSWRTSAHRLRLIVGLVRRCGMLCPSGREPMLLSDDPHGLDLRCPMLLRDL